jgi:hypothetical protein
MFLLTIVPIPLWNSLPLSYNLDDDVMIFNEIFTPIFLYIGLREPGVTGKWVPSGLGSQGQGANTLTTFKFFQYTYTQRWCSADSSHFEFSLRKSIRCN